MIGITRYHISDGNHPSVEYVTYEDHLARIAQLEAALKQLLACRDEVDAYPGNTLDLLGDMGHAARCNIGWRMARDALQTQKG